MSGPMKHGKARRPYPRHPGGPEAEVTALRAEVERLTRERDEAIADAAIEAHGMGQESARARYEAAERRVSVLEEALREALDSYDAWEAGNEESDARHTRAFVAARAALTEKEKP